jgi:ApaG protein
MRIGSILIGWLVCFEWIFPLCALQVMKCRTADFSRPQTVVPGILRRKVLKVRRVYRSSFSLDAGRGSFANLTNVQRNELWKSISNSELDALELLFQSINKKTIPPGSITIDIDNNELEREAFRLFAQSVHMRKQDPFMKLAEEYALALERRDAEVANSILLQMKSAALPPHIASIISHRKRLTDMKSKVVSDKTDRVGRATKDAATATPQGQSQLYNREVMISNIADGSNITGENEVAALGGEQALWESSSSETVTDRIRVRVHAYYDAPKSDPAAGQYVFRYKVAIFNEGAEAVQVLGRVWEVQKCRGAKEEVRGPGINSAQPILSPGDVFNYESICPLRVFPPRGTRVVGSMSGAYSLCKGSMGQHHFAAQVAKFNLILPPEVAASSGS